MTLAEFLLARAEESEQFATIARLPALHRRTMLAEAESVRRIVALHSPERVWTGSGYEDDKCATCLLSESDLYGREYEAAPCPTLRALGLPHAEHRDYREEWKP